MEIVLFLAFKTIWGIFRHCIRLIAMMEFLRNSIAYFTTLLYGFYVHVSSIFPKFIFVNIVVLFNGILLVKNNCQSDNYYGNILII